jgi:titin
VDLTNNTGSPARLGGYGLWDATSSRYNNNGSIENRAAYLFDPNLTLAAGATLRVYFGSTSAAAAPGIDQVAYANGVSAGGAGGFVELANLNGAQVACMATSGTPCVKAKVTSTPSSPLGVTARTTPSSVTVNWGAPVSRGGLPISSYTATAFNDPVNGSAIGSCSTDGAGRSCSFPGSIGTKYWVQVSASNAAGTSAPSWRVLAAPRTVPSAPGSVSASGTPGGINVSWTPAAENGAGITKYTAAAYTAGTGGSPVGTCATSTGALTRCTISGLAGGSTYFVDVKATNRAGTGAPSSPRVTAVPGPGTAISTYSKRRVTVRWDAPADPTGITGYTAKVYTKASKGSLLATCTAPVGATSCTTKKLKKRSKFYIDLITQTASGSSVVKPRIVTGPPRKASAPRVTSATPAGRQVAIAWAAPSFTGYTTLSSYGARLYSKSKGGSVKASCSAGAGSLTCTTKALKKKGSYYAAVRVKNSKGWSSWSKRLKVVVR